MAAGVGSFHVNCGALQFSVHVQLKDRVLSNVATEVDNSIGTVLLFRSSDETTLFLSV